MKTVKPYLSSMTISSMLVLVFLIVTLKADMIIAKWFMVARIIALEILMILLRLD